jgi:hypothetical protein
VVLARLREVDLCLLRRVVLHAVKFGTQSFVAIVADVELVAGRLV